MDFGTLDNLIEEEDLAEADKKKILQSKQWQEHIKEHPNAELHRVEKEGILNPETPPPPEQPSKVDAFWLKEEEKKTLPETPPPVAQHTEPHPVGWECNCGKAMQPPKDKDTSTAYKIQKDDEEEDSLYKNTSPEGVTYGRNETPNGVAYHAGNEEAEDHINQLYRHQ